MEEHTPPLWVVGYHLFLNTPLPMSLSMTISLVHNSMRPWLPVRKSPFRGLLQMEEYVIGPKQRLYGASFTLWPLLPVSERVKGNISSSTSFQSAVLRTNHPSSSQLLQAYHGTTMNEYARYSSNALMSPASGFSSDQWLKCIQLPV